MQKCLSKLQTQFVILGIVGVWLFLLTVGFFILISFFRRLSKSAKDLDIRKIFEKIIEGGEKNSQAIERIKEEIARIQADDTFHIQKVGFVRFNPFKETGGDHSFSLAILDAKDTGIILTGLHTRERTRVYVKEVKNGKSDFELSDDEKAALKKAQKE